MASAGASAQTVVPLGRVVLWSDVFHVLPALAAPADGAVNGYGLTATVTGDKCASSIGTGTDELSAPAGARVCVFSLDYEGGIADFVTDTGQVIPQLQGTISVGSQALPLSQDEIDQSGSVDYALAVPDGQSATLSLSAAGFAQSFSLTAARPVGVRPEVLYESASQTNVRTLVGTTFRFTETSVADGKHATMTTRVSSAVLGWSTPETPLCGRPIPTRPSWP